MADGITIDVRADIARLTRQLDDVQRRQIPFATAQALTWTAKAAQPAVRTEMQRVFDRPTPFTLDATFIRPATKTRLQAEVYLKDFAGKGTPAAKYLAPQIAGGSRAEKRFERALRARGLLPGGYFAVPSVTQQLDPYGNAPRGLYVQILSDLRAFAEVGYKANRLTKAEARSRGKRYRQSRFFVILPGKGTQPGIYRRAETRSYSRRAIPVFVFVRQPTYRARFDFVGVVARTAAREFGPTFERSLRAALATAR